MKVTLTNLNLFMNEPIKLASKINLQDQQLLRIGPSRIHYVFDPEVAIDILKSPNFSPLKRIFQRIKPVTGKKGLVQIKGEQSNKLRTQVLKHINSKTSVQTIKEIVTKNTEELMDNLPTETPIDIAPIMTDLILKNAFELFTGTKNTQVNPKLIKNYQELNYRCGRLMRSLVPYAEILPTYNNLKILLLSLKIKKFVKKLENNSSDTESLIKPLLNSKESLDHILTFLFAGHETLAASLSFSLLKLGTEEEFQDKINAVGNSYIRKFYNEVLRFFPPAYMLVRQCLFPHKIKNYNFAKGDQIIIAISEIHKSGIYFSNPQNFNPERFNASPSKAFMPFGIGPKSCVGINMAYQEAQIVLGLICKNFEVLTIDKKIKANAFITLHPQSGQKIILKKRDHK